MYAEGQGHQQWDAGDTLVMQLWISELIGYMLRTNDRKIS